MAEFQYSPPTVVHLKKKGGNIVQDCDVYIGNAIRNSNWELEESKWCDPFHQRWDLKLKERRKKYRDYVTSKPELMRSLTELRGKVLGCLCQSPLESCHGQVLVELVTRAHGEQEDYCTKESKGNIFYFKGSFSPLSNFYPAPVIDGPPKRPQLQKKFKLGSFQLYYYSKAIDAGVLKIANAIRKAKTIQKVRQWSKKIPVLETPLSNQIISMHRILSLKYSQTPAVRQALQRVLLTNRVPAEATSNAFWGCGVDMRVVRKNTAEQLYSNEVGGKNYLGWILALIHAEKTGNFYWLPLLKKLPPSMVEGFQEVKSILAEKGLSRCPPITRLDLEDGPSDNSSSGASTNSRSGGSNRGDVVFSPELPVGGEIEARTGDGPGLERFADSTNGGEECSVYPL